MTEKNKSAVIEYDSIQNETDWKLVEQEYRFSEGDAFALIEAMAICAKRELPYPRWVREKLDKVSVDLFASAFPTVDLKQKQGAFQYDDPFAVADADRREEFNAARDGVLRVLGLSIQGVHPLERRKNVIRDLALVELIGRFTATVKKKGKNARPMLKGVDSLIEKLATGLNITPDEWRKRHEEDGNLIGDMTDSAQKPLKVRTVPIVCINATKDQIRWAWKKYRGGIYEERFIPYED